MKGAALFIYGEDYDSLVSLTSPKASVSHVQNELIIPRSKLTPNWEILEHSTSVGNTDNLISKLNQFADGSYLSNCHVNFVYICGHGYTGANGETYIYSTESTPGQIGAGLSVVDIVQILCKENVPRLVLCLDVCRVGGNQPTEQRKLLTLLKEKIPKDTSATILFSTHKGRTSYGGTQNKPSPFSLALGEILATPNIDASSINLKTRFETILCNSYEEFKLSYSKPEILNTREANSMNLYGLMVEADTEYTPLAAESNSALNLAGLIVTRELESIEGDYYVSSPSDLIPLEIVAHGRKFDLIKKVASARDPMIIEGRSGAGKSLYAKEVSRHFASHFITHQNGKIALYVNAGYLDKYSEVDISGDEILGNLISRVRYGFAIEDLILQFGKGNIILLIDGIEDLVSSTLLVKFLNDCRDKFDTSYIIFCQPGDSELINTELHDIALTVAKLVPISKQQADSYLEASVNIKGFTDQESYLPRDYQLLKEYISEHNRLPETHKEILQFNYHSLEEKLAQKILVKYPVNADEIQVVKSRFMSIFKQFALGLRDGGKYQYFEAKVGELIFQQIDDISTEPKITFRDMVDVAIRSNIFLQDAVTVRYSHRAVQELLIAKEWVDSSVKDEEIINKCQDNRWESTIAIYSVLCDEKKFPFQNIVEKNSFLIIECLNRGFEASEEQIEITVEQLLKVASHWTRNLASLKLSKLPEKISSKLMSLFSAELDFKRKVCIAISLGRLEGESNIDFLLSEYAKLHLIESADDDTRYLRRRILDFIKNKYGVERLNEWFGLNPKVGRKGWARIFRSVRIESKQDINHLESFITENFSEPDLSIYEAILEYQRFVHLQELHEHTGADRLRLCTALLKLIEHNDPDRTYRCIPALIIVELRLHELYEELLNALKRADDIYEMGEIAFVLGTAAGHDIVSDMFIYLSTEIKSPRFNLHNEMDQQGFFNDLELGVVKAIHDGRFDEKLPIGNFPEDFQQVLFNNISMYKDT